MTIDKLIINKRSEADSVVDVDNSRVLVKRAIWVKQNIERIVDIPVSDCQEALPIKASIVTPKNSFSPIGLPYTLEKPGQNVLTSYSVLFLIFPK